MRTIAQTVALATLLAFTLLTGTLLATTIVAEANECNDWAAQLGQSDVRDSVVMHAVGCDDGPKADTNYQRSEGRCAAAARHAYRHGYEPFTLAFNLNVGRDHQCVSYEDWTWAEE